MKYKFYLTFNDFRSIERQEHNRTNRAMRLYDTFSLPLYLMRCGAAFYTDV